MSEEKKGIDFNEIKARIRLSDFAKTKLGVIVTKDNRACCHLHHEKTPSLHFNDEKRFYYCFGCHKSGDVFSLTQEIKGFSFLEAVKFVAESTGIILEADYNIIRNSKNFSEKRDVLHEMMEDICQFFQKNLTEEVLKYLDSRQIKNETIKKFRLGFAPSIYNQANKELINRLSNKYKTNINLLLDSGLFRRSFSKSQNDNLGSINSNQIDFYNILHDRIIFPICDKFGKVIAFGGRIIKELEQNTKRKAPKYLNCGDSLIFKKSEILYCENFARKKANEENSIIIVEGYLDCIHMNQSGIENVVAPLGTAISDFQIRYLWNICDKIICSLDGDLAGQKALITTIKKSLSLIQAGKFIAFCQLPENFDPADMITQGNLEELKDMIKNSSPISKKILNSVLSKYSDDPDSIAGAKRELIAYLRLIQDEMVKNEYAKYFKYELDLFSNRKKTNLLLKNINDQNFQPIKTNRDNSKNYNIKNRSNEKIINVYDEIFCYLIVLIFKFPDEKNLFINDELLNKIYSKSNYRHELKNMINFAKDFYSNKNINDLKTKFPNFANVLDSKEKEIARYFDKLSGQQLWLKYFFYNLRLIELKESQFSNRENPYELIKVNQEERKIKQIINDFDSEGKNEFE